MASSAIAANENWFCSKMTIRRVSRDAARMAFGASEGITRMSSGRKAVSTSTGAANASHSGNRAALFVQAIASKPSSRSASTCRKITFCPPATAPVG